MRNLHARDEVVGVELVDEERPGHARFAGERGVGTEEVRWHDRHVLERHSHVRAPRVLAERAVEREAEEKRAIHRAVQPARQLLEREVVERRTPLVHLPLLRPGQPPPEVLVLVAAGVCEDRHRQKEPGTPTPTHPPTQIVSQPRQESGAGA